MAHVWVIYISLLFLALIVFGLWGQQVKNDELFDQFADVLKKLVEGGVEQAKLTQEFALILEKAIKGEDIVEEESEE